MIRNKEHIHTLKAIIDKYKQKLKTGTISDRESCILSACEDQLEEYKTLLENEVDTELLNKLDNMFRYSSLEIVLLYNWYEKYKKVQKDVEEYQNLFKLNRYLSIINKTVELSSNILREYLHKNEDNDNEFMRNLKKMHTILYRQENAISAIELNRDYRQIEVVLVARNHYLDVIEHIKDMDR